MRFTKNEYQQRLKTYVDRRSELRARYGREWKKSEDYKKSVVRINAQIKVFKRAIRRYTHIHDQIRERAWIICEFLDITLLRGAQPLRNSVGNRGKAFTDGRNLLYKWSLENGIQGTQVSWWVGARGKETASQGRLRFTRSFQNNPENKALWNHFKLYLNSLNSEVVLKKSVAA